MIVDGPSKLHHCHALKYHAAGLIKKKVTDTDDNVKINGSAAVRAFCPRRSQNEMNVIYWGTDRRLLEVRL